MIAAGVAWLAAWDVAVDSSGPPHKLQFLSATSFAAAGIAILGSLIVLAVMYDWITRLAWLHSDKNAPPLKVVAGDPHYHNWNYAASVVALPIKVTNTTSAPVILPGGSQIRENTGNTPSWMEKLGKDETGSFLREVESQKRTSHHQPNIIGGAVIPAHSTLEFWYVTDVSRDQRGVHLDMTIYFKDDDGNDYSAVFERIAKPSLARVSAASSHVEQNGEEDHLCLAVIA
jgi:hypothetical protein